MSGPGSPDLGISARSAARTASAQFGAKAAVGAIALALTAVVTHALTTSEYAAWGTAVSIAGVVAFALDPGLTPVVVRRLATAGAEVPSPRSILRLRLLLAAGSYAVVVAVTTGLRGWAAAPIAAVLAAELFPRAAVLTGGTWLQSEHRLHRQTNLEALCAALGLAAGLLLWQVGAAPPMLAFGVVVMPSLILAVTSMRMARAMESFRRVLSTSTALLREILREVAPLAGALALVSIYTRIDVVFVSAGSTTTGLASYVLAFRFIDQIAVAAGVVAGALFPLFAARFSKSELFTDEAIPTGLVLVTALGAGAGAALMVFAHPLIDLIAPARLAPAAGLLILLAPTAAALFMNFYIGYLLMSMGRAGRYLWLNLIGLGVNLAGNAVFTLSHGAPAAARLTWATEFAVALAAAQPVFAAGREGRRATLTAAGSVVIVIAASEAAWAGASPVACGLGAIAAVAILAGRRLLLGLRAVVGGRAAA